MALRLYDTFGKHEKEFAPHTPGKVGMYTCGPTVYSRPHIGNYSSFLMADLLRRWLEAGHNLTVTHVKNITDVGHLLHDQDHGDDKIEKEARKEKIDPLEIARRYTEQYLEDEKALNLLEPAHRPRATETVPEMLEMIKKLLADGHAYETDDGYYFSVLSFPRYGQLSGNTLDNVAAGARVEVNEYKKHPADFALWKKCVGDNARHLLRWSFDTGLRTDSVGDDARAGFPGWHIECSAMSRTFLGDTFDLHTGGEDNIFPHHECEIAQSESFSKKSPFVGIWLHKRRIDLAGEKMSKSLGNVIGVPDIIAKGFSPMDLRYYLLSVHYRTNLKFSWKGMEDARVARRSITEWMERGGSGETSPAGKHIDAPDGKKVQEYDAEFSRAMDADLNVSAALAAVFGCMHYMNTVSMPDTSAKAVLTSFIQKVSHTFGCFEPEVHDVPAEVQSLLDAREAARAAKNFAESDRLRDEIMKRGYTVKDTPKGQVIRKV